MNPTLLVYDGSKQANSALRWLMMLAECSRLATLRVLVIFRKEVERQVMSHEVNALAEAHDVCVEVEVTTRRDGLRRTIELAEELQAAIVAMPAYAFPGLLGFRRVGVEMSMMEDINASLLLFP